MTMTIQRNTAATRPAATTALNKPAAFQALLAENKRVIQAARHTPKPDAALRQRIHDQLKQSTEVFGQQDQKDMKNAGFRTLVCQIRDLAAAYAGVPMDNSPTPPQSAQALKVEPEPQPQVSRYLRPMTTWSKQELLDGIDHDLWFIDAAARFSHVDGLDKQILGAIQELSTRENTPKSEIKAVIKQAQKRLSASLKSHFDPRKLIEPLFFSRELKIALILKLKFELAKLTV